MDKDRDGYLTEQEIKEALAYADEPVSDEIVNEMLAAADADKDGKISYKGEEMKLPDCF